MAMKWTPLRVMVFMIMLVVIPLIYIAAFNQFFGTGIVYTPENWLLTFLALILVFLLFLVLVIVAVGGAAIAGPLGVVLALVAILSLPVLFIFSFNLLLGESVPYTVYTYLLVAVTIIGIWLLGALVDKAVY
jgi:hypothetical protein